MLFLQLIKIIISNNFSDDVVEIIFSIDFVRFLILFKNISIRIIDYQELVYTFNQDKYKISMNNIFPGKFSKVEGFEEKNEKNVTTLR